MAWHVAGGFGQAEVRVSGDDRVGLSHHRATIAAGLNIQFAEHSAIEPGVAVRRAGYLYRQGADHRLSERRRRGRCSEELELLESHPSRPFTSRTQRMPVRFRRLGADGSVSSGTSRWWPPLLFAQRTIVPGCLLSRRDPWPYCPVGTRAFSSSNQLRTHHCSSSAAQLSIQVIGVGPASAFSMLTRNRCPSAVTSNALRWSSVRGGPRFSDRLLRWSPDPTGGIWNATKETELPG